MPVKKSIFMMVGIDVNEHPDISVEIHLRQKNEKLLALDEFQLLEIVVCVQFGIVSSISGAVDFASKMFEMICLHDYDDDAVDDDDAFPGRVCE